MSDGGDPPTVARAARGLQAGPPLIGRDGEVRRLAELLAGSTSRGGTVAVVEGEAGIGKTRLCAEVIAEARGSGFEVLAGAATEMERDRPFGAIAEALSLRAHADDPERAAVARLLSGGPGIPMPDAPGLRFRIADDLVALVERSATMSPVLLVLEDLHWADPSTFLVVHLVVRQLADRPVTILGTCRPLPRPRELDLLTEEARARGLHMVLSPLGAEATIDLVRHLAGAPPGGTLLEQVTGAAGNPFFLNELIAALREEGAIEVIEGRAEARTTTLPPSLRLTILQRLSALPERTLDALRVAAVLGSSFALDDLAIVSGHDVSLAAEAIRDAVRAGVIEGDHETLRFRHDLIREALYGDMPVAVRRAMHMLAARALDVAGASAIRVGEQVAAGASEEDADAVPWLRRAARDAAPRAPAVAVRFLDRALELVARTHVERAPIVAEMLEPLVWSGEASRAEQLAREVLTHPLPPETECVLRSGVAGLLAFRGRVPDAIGELQRAAAVEGIDARTRARLSAAAASVHALVVGDATSTQLCEAADEAARAAGSRFAAALTSQARAVLAAAAGRIEDAVASAREALTLAQQMGEREGRWEPFLIPHFYLGMFLVAADRFDEAEQVALDGQRTGETTGVPVMLSQWVGIAAWLWSGRWDDAEAEIEGWLRFAEEAGVGVGVVQSHACLAFLHLQRNDLPAAEATIQRAADALARLGPQGGIELVPWVRALVLEAQDRPGEAADVAVAAWDTLVPVRRLSLAATLMGPDFVRITHAAGDIDTADRILEELQGTAARASVASVEVAALRARALRSGDAAAALAAVERSRSSPRVLERALACEEAAALAPPDRARELLEQASDLYDAIGASRGSTRVDASLRALGVRRRRSAARTRPATGWASLTPAEMKVVRLTAEGLTNRQIGERLFISRRTVETHLAHVFQKLGIATRAQLAAEAARHEG